MIGLSRAFLKRERGGERRGEKRKKGKKRGRKAGVYLENFPY